jgi:hypothetical protein
MISKFFDMVVDYLKGKSFWPLIEPLFTLGSLYVLAVVIAYQYIEWRYHFTPELTTFLHSYIVKQISVVFLTFLLLALVLGTKWKAGVRSEVGARLGGWVRSGAKKLVVADHRGVRDGGVSASGPCIASAISLSSFGEAKIVRRTRLPTSFTS